MLSVLCMIEKKDTRSSSLRQKKKVCVYIIARVVEVFFAWMLEWFVHSCSVSSHKCMIHNLVRVTYNFSIVICILAVYYMLKCIFLFCDKYTIFLCQLTCQSADIILSLCGVGVRVRVNNFFSKTTRPRDMLFFLKDTLSIEDEKLFKACKSVCSSVC